MIRILPEHIANRIAAGEVVQRPSSVVKELLENAIDAGATVITLIAEDAGRTLIQVIDNGCGMSTEEAQIAFERHATSKISKAEDLEYIQTFGFRGEALAAIAAVSDVTLKTRQDGEETGTQIRIQGSRLVEESPVSCPVGTIFEVRNLFYNVPARRKFLKSDTAEFKHIVAEFSRIALCRSDIELRLIHNGQELFNLPPTKLKQRLGKLLGKEIIQELVDIEVISSIIKISGYIGKPEDARKSIGNQFFFVNGRFFKSAYFQRAVLNAYEHLIPDKSFPSWCIFMEVNPEEVDVNIHPAKTEVKIENDQMIFQILQSAIKEALGKNALIPSIDFDMEGAPSIPPLKRGLFAPPPKVNYDPLFNPFNEASFEVQKNSYQPLLYDSAPEIFAPAEKFQSLQPHIFSLKGKYLLTPVKSGVMIIHIRRAHQRIRYEHWFKLITQNGQESQQTLFPQEHTLNPSAVMVFEEMREDLLQMGFDLRPAGKERIVVFGLPVGYPTENEDVAIMLDLLATHLAEHTMELRDEIAHTIALSLSIAECRRVLEMSTPNDSMQFVDTLFACSQPAISPIGKTSIYIIPLEELDKMLNETKPIYELLSK
jgi:DNA mismatch repair protein MutL